MSRGVTRRDVFSGLGVGVVGSLAGCFEAAVSGGDEPAPGDWPMSGYDAANTGVSPDAPGPDGPGEWWRFATDREVAASPAVVGDTVYVNTLRGNTHALDAATGEEAWRTDLGVGLTKGPVVWNGSVYVGSTDTVRYGHETRLFALDAATGEPTWDAPLDGSISGSPVAVDGTVLAGTWDGTLHAFDAADGTERWRTGVGLAVTAAPAAAGGRLYASTIDRELHAVAVGDGTVEWTAPTDGDIPGSPAVAGDAVYVATGGREILAIGG